MKGAEFWLTKINKSATLRTRLLGGFVLLAVIAVVPLLLMRGLSRQAADDQGRWKRRADTVRYSRELKHEISATQIAQYDYVLTRFPASDRKRLTAWSRAQRLLGRARSATVASHIEISLDRVEKDLTALRAAQKKVIESAGKSRVSLAVQKTTDIGDRIDAGLDEIIASETRDLNKLDAQSRRRANTEDWLVLGGILADGAAAVVLALLAYTTLISRLVHMRQGVTELSSGNTGVRVNVDGGDDEISLLYAEFNDMAQSLEETAKEQNHRYSQLTNLYQISKAISASPDVDKLLDQILTQALSLLGAETGSIMLLNIEGEALTIRAANGLDRETIEKTRVKVGEGISGTVALTGEPLIIQDGVEESRVPGSRAANDALSVPLIAGEKVIGVINANNKRHGSFDSDDLHFFTTLAGQIAAAVANATLVDNIRAAYFNTIKVLAAAIDAKDKYTHGHSERVAKYAVTIARQMGLDKADLIRIEAAAYLHDIGKIGVPDGVLNKEGPLTPEEMALVMNHPAMAAEILGHVDFPWGNVIPGVRGHHERFDGKGYPDGLAGYDIPSDARIIAVADTFDAMTSDRPYRKALDHNKAITELVTGRRGQFDQEVVDAFVPALLTTLMTSVRGGIEDQSRLEFSATSHS